MDIKNKLKLEVWENKGYYTRAHEASLDVNHPGMKTLIALAQKVDTILDLGCGEGTRLNLLLRKGNKGVGVDLSDTAITVAKKTHPNLEFIRSDLEELPLRDNSFDLVYLAFVLEHLTNPQKALTEAVRVLSKDGTLVIIAPNFGAPNRASPPFRRSRIVKFITGIGRDFFSMFYDRLNIWDHVEPLADAKNYDVDWDTVTEPYVKTVINFLKSKRLKIMYYTSCWSEELPNVKIHQRVFRKLGELNLYPFTMWGPHLVVVAKKDA